MSAKYVTFVHLLLPLHLQLSLHIMLFPCYSLWHSNPAQKWQLKTSALTFHLAMLYWSVFAKTSTQGHMLSSTSRLASWRVCNFYLGRLQSWRRPFKFGQNNCDSDYILSYFCLFSFTLVSSPCSGYPVTLLIITKSEKYKMNSVFDNLEVSCM